MVTKLELIKVLQALKEEYLKQSRKKGLTRADEGFNLGKAAAYEAIAIFFSHNNLAPPVDPEDVEETGLEPEEIQAEEELPKNYPGDWWPGMLKKIQKEFEVG